MLQFKEEKKLTMSKVHEKLKEISGIAKRTKYQNKKCIFDGFIFCLSDVIKWINDNLEIPDEYSKQLESIYKLCSK